MCSPAGPHDGIALWYSPVSLFDVGVVFGLLAFPACSTVHIPQILGNITFKSAELGVPRYFVCCLWVFIQLGANDTV